VEGEVGGACSAHGTEETDVEGFAGEPELKRPCEISSHKWEEITKEEA
jgi:hypothetical protein